MRLGTSISLETMKQALENKDKDLALARKEARTKTKLADQKLASVGKLEDEIKDLKAIVRVFTQEKQVLEEKVTQLTDKKNILEKHVEEVCEELNEKLVGKFSSG